MIAAAASISADPLVASWQQHEKPAGLPPLKSDTDMFTIIVVPETRVLVTSLAKVGSTTLSHLFVAYRAHLPGVSPALAHLLLTGKRPDRPHERTMDIHARSNPQSLGWDLHQLKQALADPTWRTVAFVRDPVARFASAFISKCVPGHDKDWSECIFLPEEVLQQWDSIKSHRASVMLSPDRWPTIDDAVQHLAAAMRGDGRAVKNLHWRPQTQLGGGLSNSTGLPYYNAVVVYDAETFGTRMAQVLEFVGVQEQHRVELMQRVHKERVRTPRHNTGAHKRLCDLVKTPEQLRVIVDFYADDYREFAFLGLAPPTWEELCG